VIALGVLISGEGTNLQSVLDAIAAKKLDARVNVVISNVASARGLDRAKAANIPTVAIDHNAFTNRKSFDHAVVKSLRDHGAEWIVLAGFMRIVTDVLLDAFPFRVVNVHPALLPAFPGTNGPAQALAYGVRLSGCTVHFVDVGTDTGPILAQAAVPVMHDDDEHALRARIQSHEHVLLPEVLQWISEGRVSVDSSDATKRPRVRVTGVQTARFDR
jgi:phosphoribosylglycinamide formyltransferase-1